VLFLVTDGLFDSSGYKYKAKDGQESLGSDAVIGWMRDNNPRDKNDEPFVHVYPIIVSSDKPDAETENVMKTIAKENGGKARFVTVE
jgi:hypothetical protein